MGARRDLRSRHAGLKKASFHGRRYAQSHQRVGYAQEQIGSSAKGWKELIPHVRTLDLLKLKCALQRFAGFFFFVKICGSIKYLEMPTDDIGPALEPNEDVIFKRDAILGVVSAMDVLDEKSLRAWAFKKFGMPVELMPLVRAFSECKIPATEVIAHWTEMGGASKGNASN
jgi:hypothetical protein